MIDAISTTNIAATANHLEALILASDVYTDEQKKEACASISALKVGNPIEVFGMGVPTANFDDPEHVAKAWGEPPPQFLGHAIRAVMSGAAMCDVYQLFVEQGDAPPREIWEEDPSAPNVTVRGGEPTE